MKGLLVLGAVVAVVLVAFVAFIRFGASNASEPTDLTQEVGAVVVRSEAETDRRLSQNSGYRVVYSYEAGEGSYTSEAWVPETLWTPRRGLVTICVDPDDPADHVVPTRVNAECGEGSVGRNAEQRAETSSP